ncbi:hypothetical protein GmHk_16G046541 [Glycine max]|nr:hypothetical protein GmHk_16G046541 [Glycine max]
MLTENTPLIEDPASPIERHVKLKLAHTKRYRQMTSQATQEISDRIDSLQEQTMQGTFVLHGRDDILNTAIGRLEHPSRVRAVGSDSTITPNKVVEPVQRSNNIVVDDPLRRLNRTLYDIYKKPAELLWDGTKFVIPNADASFFLTYFDYNEDMKTTVDGKTDQATPQWIEANWFGDGTPIDKETITTIRNKWATYFVKVKDCRFRKI